ncbi:MAG: endonuclease/exonuclease/phosphatase family protein [Planctomycetota bacterium]
MQHYDFARFQPGKFAVFAMTLGIAIACEAHACPSHCQERGPAAHLTFDANTTEKTGRGEAVTNGNIKFVRGLTNKAIRFQADGSKPSINFAPQKADFNPSKSFSVATWFRTTVGSDQRIVLLSTKSVSDNGLSSQRKRGWMMGVANGTWWWNMGSGRRRISYDRTNGQFMPANDGRWHQLGMTYDAATHLVRLYFDGRNKVTYNVRDSGSFDFGTDGGLTIGWTETEQTHIATELPAFTRGAEQLQRMLDAFTALGLEPVTQGEFKTFVSRPARLLAERVQKLRDDGSEQSLKLVERVKDADLKQIETLSRQLMRSPYTVHQSSYYNEVALLFKLYRIEDGKVVIHQPTAERLAKRDVLRRPEFDMDDLKIWNRVVAPREFHAAYNEFFPLQEVVRAECPTALTAGSWNIYHGGLHQSIDEHGVDSRDVIVELLKREKVDVVMMQETYSSGDHIAAELGFYYATTIDWDNMFQGANISVLSRYPIKEIAVPPKSTFMNVTATVALSNNQDIYVMSNWFGMRNFDDVFAFNKQRFAESDRVPVLFAGDFNAVPHTDGGTSPASRKLLEAGFTDAYRSQHRTVKSHPGYTHRSNRRIDQLYFKGKLLSHRGTTVISKWPSGFPSDHYLIRTQFDLNQNSAASEKSAP